MNIGIPKERRPFEARVGLPPAAVEILSQHGHQVYVEHEAGAKLGFDDHQFEQAGARLVYSPEEVFGRADLLLKVARPTRDEIELAAARQRHRRPVAPCLLPPRQSGCHAGEEDHIDRL